MKAKMLIVCCALLFCIPVGVFGVGLEHSQMRSASSNFKGMSDLEIVFGIQHLVSRVIEYEFYQYPRWVYHTWGDRSGDCTDMSEVSAFMLGQHHLPYQRVHGYAFNGTDWNKHDWLEVQVMVRLDSACPDCIVKKKGDDYW